MRWRPLASPPILPPLPTKLSGGIGQVDDAENQQPDGARKLKPDASPLWRNSELIRSSRRPWTQMGMLWTRYSFETAGRRKQPKSKKSNVYPQLTLFRWQANTAFEEHMGPLYKFQGFPFADAPAEADGKGKLRSAIENSRLPPGSRGSCSARNVEMLSLAADGGLPIRRHFDWTAGVGSDGNVVMYGVACSNLDVEEREKDAERVDFFQNAPTFFYFYF